MGTQLFWYKLVFMTELLIVTGLFTKGLNRKSGFIWRAAGSVAVCYAAAFAVPLISFSAFYISVLFLLLFGIMLCAIKFCFREPLVNVLFIGILSYTTRHLAYMVYNLSAVAFNLVEAGYIGAYGDYVTSDYSAWSILAYVVSVYSAYWLMYLVFGFKLKSSKDLKINNVSLLFLSGAIILIDIVFNAIIVYYSADSFDKIYIIMTFLYGIVSCLLALFLQFSILGRNQMRRERDTEQALRHQAQEQYAVSKENIELINLKCHDIKHHILALKGRIDDEELEKIESSVSVFGSFVRTGNEVLDVILTEKSLYCEKNGIKLSCNIGDSKLDFISTVDLYSLMGNVIDNAVEAAMRVEDRAKRVICLNIKAANNLLSVHIENYFDGKITFKGGLPVTTKGDERLHGFGMKSVRAITEKYDGNMTARAADGIFKLDILLPFTQKRKIATT